MLTVNDTLLAWAGTGAAENVWLHGLYIHVSGVSDPNDSVHALVSWRPHMVLKPGQVTTARTPGYVDRERQRQEEIALQAASKRLWITSVTFSGGDRSIRAASPIFAAGVLQMVAVAFVCHSFHLFFARDLAQVSPN